MLTVLYALYNCQKIHEWEQINMANYLIANMPLSYLSGTLNYSEYVRLKCLIKGISLEIERYICI